MLLNLLHEHVCELSEITIFNSIIGLKSAKGYDCTSS